MRLLINGEYIKPMDNWEITNMTKTEREEQDRKISNMYKVWKEFQIERISK